MLRTKAKPHPLSPPPDVHAQFCTANREIKCNRLQKKMKWNNQPVVV